MTENEMTERERSSERASEMKNTEEEKRPATNEKTADAKTKNKEAETATEIIEEPKVNRALSSVSTILQLFKTREIGKKGVDKRVIKFLEYTTNEKTPVPEVKPKGEQLTMIWKTGEVSLTVSMDSQSERLEFNNKGKVSTIENNASKIASMSKKILQKISEKAEN